MPAPTYTQAGALARLNVMPDGVKLGSLSKGGFGSIVSNVFHNTTSVPYSSYNKDDAQMTTGAEAYAYRPEVIRDTLLVMTVGQRAWLTQRLSPVQIMPETAKILTWTTTKFKNSFATQVPNLGIPRLARYEKIKVQAAMKRTGKAYAMEHDFMSMREGLRYHLAQLEQIANAMRDTIYHDILFTVVNAHQWERNYIRQKKIYGDQSAEEYFRDQVWAFAMLQKEKNAFPKMDAQIDERMTWWGGQADTYIIPPQIIRYVNLVPRENNSFMEAGPIGQQRLYDSIRPYATVNTTDVFVARSYLQDEMVGARQLLEDTKEFGEFYRMQAPRYNPDAPYRTSHCNIMIFSFKHDEMREITQEWALDAAGLFRADNDEPIYLSDAGPYRLTSNNRSGEEQLDIFNFSYVENGVTKYSNARFFGEMEPRYFNLDDKIYMANTVLNTLRQKLGTGCGDLLCNFSEGIGLLRRIQAIGGTDANLTILLAIADAAGVGLSARVDALLSPTLGLPEFVQDPATGFLGPAAGFVLRQLIPGLQSEAGLRFLIRYGTNELSAEKLIAAKFLTAVNDIARHLESYFPNNVALSREFVSSVWQYPTASTGFVDNLLAGGYNPPLFIRAAGAGALAAGDAYRIALNNFIQGVPVAFQLDLAETLGAAGVTDLSRDYLFVIVGLLQFLARQPLADQAAIDAFKVAIGMEDVPAAGNVAAFIRVNLPALASEQDAANQLDTLLDNLAANFATFANFANANARRTFITTLMEQSEALRNSGQIIGSDFYRSPFLVSRALASSLSGNSNVAAAIRNRFRVANPSFPDIPASPEQALPSIIGARSDAPGITFTSALLSQIAAMNIADPNPTASAEQQGQYTGVETVMVGAAPAYNYPMRSPAASAAASLRAQFGVQVPAAVARDTYTDTARLALKLGNRMFGAGMIAGWASVEANVPDALLAAIIHVYDLTPIHRRAFIQWYNNDILTPIDFYITRPHIQVSQLNVVKMKAGSDTMITGVSPGQFEVADDAATQSHIGTVTGKHGVLMMKPENVCNQKGAMINGVLGGLGVNMIDPAKYDMGMGNFTNQDIIVIPVARRDRFDGNVLSLTGSLDTVETRALGLAQEKGVQFETYPRVNRRYGFIEGRSGVNTEDTAVAAMQDEYTNVICLAGTHVTVDQRTSEYKYVRKGQSFLTGLIWPKCGNLLAGKMTGLPEVMWSTFVEL